MPNEHAQLVSHRREEIVNACRRLYETMSFKEITLQNIADVTTFTRPSIYNYFRTKEEIFLAMLQKEYDQWADELEAFCRQHTNITVCSFAEKIGDTLATRPLMLKLLSMNHFDMENNSSPERLAEFKVSYGRILEALDKCLRSFFPIMSPEDRQSFLYAFFPFMFGIYPYTFVTNEQKVALQRADVPFKYMDVRELVSNCVTRLLSEYTSSVQPE